MVRVGDGAWGRGAEAVPMGTGDLCAAFGTPYSSASAVVWKIPLLPDSVLHFTSFNPCSSYMRRYHPYVRMRTPS